MPNHGVRRLTGTRASTERRTAMSLMRGPRAGGESARPLFHRDALGEVAGLIDIAPAQDGDMVGKELKRDARHERGQQLGRRGHRENVIGAANHLMISSVANCNNLTSSRLDLLDVSHHAVVAAVSWSEKIGRAHV